MTIHDTTHTTLQLFAVGKVNSNRDIVIAPAQQLTICTLGGGCHCHAYSIGVNDAKAGRASDPLHHLSALCCIERYLMGHRDATLAAEVKASPAGGSLPPLQEYIDACAALDEDVPPTRQQRQDEAAHQADTEAHFRFCKREASDYEDYMADIDWLRHGC